MSRSKRTLSSTLRGGTLWAAATSLLLLLALCAGGCDSCGGSAAQRTMILATTTSTQDSGLLDALLPSFEARTGIQVKVIAVGTGKALSMGRRGDADALLVHAPSSEAEFMKGGYGLERHRVMHNDFLLVGPADDPAGAKGKGPAEALDAIRGGGVFVTRGDDSGTHKKERSLWAHSAGKTPPPAESSSYLATGQGMGASLRIASEKEAYTLVDRGTWLAMSGGLQLVAISEGDPELHNPYGVIVVNPERNPKVRAQEAKDFARWLISAEAQELIRGFGVKRWGRPLFTPDAAPPAGREG